MGGTVVVSKGVRRIGAALSLLAAAGLQTGCASGTMSSQESRIGRDDGTDSCRAQLVALDSTGNFFGQDILKGALIGAGIGGLAGGLLGGNWKGALIGAGAGAALGAATGYWSALQQQNYDQATLYSHIQGDLSRENEEIDRTQLAFDQLMDCRFRQAAAINADYRGGRIDRPTAEAQMMVVRQRARQDVALARQINQQIIDRGQQFNVAVNNVAPGAMSTVAPPAAARPTKIRQATPLKLRPDAASPDIGQLALNQPVTVEDARNGYALIKTAGGQQGYASADAVEGSRSVRPQRSGPTSAAASGAGDIRSLAGSNAARRDGFSQSVAVSEQASASGFEVAQ
jgi:hypothetical protein